jgi:hypothetical protein
MDRHVSTWLDEGPSRAPAGLLDSVVTRTATARQRPGWLARATGAPALDVAIGRRPLSAATWAAIVLALVATAAAIALAGSLVLRDRSVVVAPTRSPEPSEPAILSTPTPATFEPPVAQPLDLIVLDELGFEVAYDPARSPAGVGGVNPTDRTFLGQAGIPGLSLTVGWLCLLDPCSMPIGLTSAPLADGAPILVGNKIVHVKGNTSDELAASWARVVGPIDSRQGTSLGGEAGWALQTNHVAAVLVPHGDRVFVIQQVVPGFAKVKDCTGPFGCGSPPMFSALDGIASRFRFVEPVSALEVDPRIFASGIGAALDPGWRIGRDDPTTLEIDVDGEPAAARSWLRVSVQSFAPDQLPAALTDVESDLLRNDNAPEAWASNVEIPGLGNGFIVLRPGDDPAAFFLQGPSVYTVVAHGDPDGTSAWSDSEHLLRTFLAGLDMSLTDPLRPVTYDWGGLSVEVPFSWHFVDEGETSIRFAPGGGGFIATTDSINLVKAGETATIRETSANTYGVRTHEVAGKTLDELAGSIEEALGLPKGSRTRDTVAGVKAYRWFVPPTEIVGPLEAIAIFQLGRTQYIVLEYPGLESPLGTSFSTLLDGISAKG